MRPWRKCHWTSCVDGINALILNSGELGGEEGKGNDGRQKKEFHDEIFVEVWSTDSIVREWDGGEITLPDKAEDVNLYNLFLLRSVTFDYLRIHYLSQML